MLARLRWLLRRSFFIFAHTFLILYIGLALIFVGAAVVQFALRLDWGLNWETIPLGLGAAAVGILFFLFLRVLGKVTGGAADDR
jgi:hypothetical protein